MKRPSAPRVRSAAAPRARDEPAARDDRPPVTAPAPLASPAERGPRRRPLLIAAVAAAGILAPLGAGALLLRSGSDTGAPTAATTSAARTGPFPDVAAENPAAEAMGWAHETGVQVAREDGGYAPEDLVTRGAIATALHRYAGTPEVPLEAATTLLADVGQDSEVTAALLWLHGRGALWGDADLQVHPEEPATRKGAAGMIASLLRPALAGVGATWDPSPSTSVPDASELADLHWLEAAGVVPAALAGAAPDTGQSVTRADLALTLHRADQVIQSALD